MSAEESEKKALIQYRVERSRSTLRDAQILSEDEVILTREQALRILESAVQFVNSIEQKLSEQQ